jgi:hypothetical protein
VQDSSANMSHSIMLWYSSYVTSIALERDADDILVEIVRTLRKWLLSQFYLQSQSAELLVSIVQACLGVSYIL